ncbi:rhomboid family intramembrane serine protease [Candidatus Pacearchaeota archaeon]|nr:rhomboid family intramembrane serine protease [Candidatus Pacearchaeota archaeon]
MAEIYSFYPKKRSIFGFLSVTLTLVLINVALFIISLILLTLFRNNPELLYDYIALKPSNILQGKYLWTFITSMFMQAGFFHLFANMLSLIFIGTFVERIIGQKRYLFFYLISGLLAGLFFVASSLIFTSDLNTFAVGASGAIFGIAGLMAVLTPNLPLYVMFIPIPIKAKYAIPGLLVLLWLISIAGDVPIGNTAHFGGLIAGIAYGIYLKKKYGKKTRYISKRFS